MLIVIISHYLRFEVEDIIDDPSQGPLPPDHAPTSPGVQQSFTSLAYNTSEAVPNTLYYRNEENEGMPRPSLETLHLGKAPQLDRHVIKGCGNH